jgi:hypothetical protein
LYFDQNATLYLNQNDSQGWGLFIKREKTAMTKNGWLHIETDQGKIDDIMKKRKRIRTIQNRK